MATDEGKREDYTFIIWRRILKDSNRECRALGVFKGGSLQAIIREIVKDDIRGLANYLLKETKIRLEHGDSIRSIETAVSTYKSHYADEPVDAREILDFRSAYEALELELSQKSTPSS